jgi:hypothetical protein
MGMEASSLGSGQGRIAKVEKLLFGDDGRSGRRADVML